MQEKTITVTDALGFIHEVKIKNYPHLGFSTASYKDEIIAEYNSYKIHQPNDAEHEQYEELLSEWRDEAEADIILRCKDYFKPKNQ